MWGKNSEGINIKLTHLHV